MATRHGAAALADALGLGDRIDRVKAYGLDLEQGASCKERRKAVGQLRALGDKRAIPALEKSRKRVRKGGILGLERKNTNYCLQKDAGEAIEYLKAR